MKKPVIILTGGTACVFENIDAINRWDEAIDVHYGVPVEDDEVKSLINVMAHRHKAEMVLDLRVDLTKTVDDAVSVEEFLKDRDSEETCKRR